VILLFIHMRTRSPQPNRNNQSVSADNPVDMPASSSKDRHRKDAREKTVIASTDNTRPRPDEKAAKTKLSFVSTELAAPAQNSATIPPEPSYYANR
jgi:hypothetical protein